MVIVIPAIQKGLPRTCHIGPVVVELLFSDGAGVGGFTAVGGDVLDCNVGSGVGGFVGETVGGDVIGASVAGATVGA